MKIRRMSYKKGLKIKSFSIFTFFLIFVFFPPNILERISSSFDDLQRYLQLLCIGILMIDLISKRNVRFSQSHIRWGLFCIYGLILTLAFEPKSTYTFFMRVGVPVFLAVLMCMFYKNRPGGMQRLIECFYHYMMMLVVVNCVMMVLFPSGIIRSSGGATVERANWLLGSKNNVVLPLIFASTFFLFHYIQSQKRNLGKLIVFFGMVFFNLMWAGSDGLEAFGGSATGLLALLLFFAMYIIGYTPIRKILMRLSIGWYAVAFLILSAVVIIGSISENSFIGLIFGTVGKDATASSRTHIWLAAINRVRQAPIFGYGYTSKILAYDIRQTYNLFLDCIYRYGMIGLVMFISVFGSYKPQNKNEINVKMQPKYAFVVGIISMFLCSIVNTISLEYIIVLMELYVSIQTSNEQGGKVIHI